MSTEFILLYILIAGNMIWNIIEYFLEKKKSKVEIVSTPIIELNETAFEPIKDEELDKKKKRSPFKFSLIGLKPGDELISTINTDIRAIVNDEFNTIKMPNNKIYSLSKACEIIYFEKNPNASKGSTFQGPAYWTYNGETLENIRIRTENEQ